MLMASAAAQQQQPTNNIYSSWLTSWLNNLHNNTNNGFDMNATSAETTLSKDSKQSTTYEQNSFEMKTPCILNIFIVRFIIFNSSLK